MNDEERLDAILAWCDQNPDDVEAKRVPEEAMRDIADKAKRRPLSPKQSEWVGSIYERLFDTPKYENLVSSGRVPRGREVPTPPVLQNLPKRPPGR